MQMYRLPRKSSRIGNYPSTANDPPIGPQMIPRIVPQTIPERKWYLRRK